MELIEVQAGHGNVYQFVVMSYHQSQKIVEYETNGPRVSTDKILDEISLTFIQFYTDWGIFRELLGVRYYIL